ncbi:uncharacterized protein LOC117645153 [Thrips palmi]|uniref:Uncharacterized protein LOC117645153 n=1 Tax=Thrips palmi TaxID=161013 RepID=A0A6P8YU48_THRPL|nr:uncharacterized protein LOC117645153 [Thrips palmi]
MYCHPSACVDTIIEAIDVMLPAHPLPRTTILAGDFNKDMQQPAGRRIAHTLAARSLTSTSDLRAHTTYGAGSTIDAVFSNAAAMTVGAYQAYFSHHLPLVIDVPK